MGRKYRKHRGVRNGPGGPHRSSRRAIPWRGSAGTDWPRFGHAKTSSRGGDGVFRLGTMLSEGSVRRLAAARQDDRIDRPSARAHRRVRGQALGSRCDGPVVVGLGSAPRTPSTVWRWSPNRIARASTVSVGFAYPWPLGNTELPAMNKFASP